MDLEPTVQRGQESDKGIAMAFEQKDNSGAIFKNDKKEKDTHPDYRGPIRVDGKDKEISLWVKKDKNGKSYFSVAIKEPYKKEPRYAGDSDTAPRKSKFDDLDSDVPF